MNLIPDWKRAYTFLSVHAGLVASTALIAWIATPEPQQKAILSVVGLNTPAALALIGFVAVIALRLVNQEPKK